MLQQTIWSLRYSLEGAIKRILFVSERPLSEEELETALMQNCVFREQRSKDNLGMRIRKALRAPHGAFVPEGSNWTLRKTEHDALHDEVFSLFLQVRHPLKQGEILRLLQQKTHRSKGELMSRIDLERDWRFARLEDGDWVLTEWNLDAIEESVQTAKEEPAMDNRTDLVAHIAAELEGYLSQLQQRSQEIPQEVVEKFNLEDLKSIEQLMEEKKRIAGFMNDLQELVARWSQRKEPVSS